MSRIIQCIPAAAVEAAVSELFLKVQQGLDVLIKGKIITWFRAVSTPRRALGAISAMKTGTYSVTRSPVSKVEELCGRLAFPTVC
jgi:hypothetical protein